MTTSEPPGEPTPLPSYTPYGGPFGGPPTEPVTELPALAGLGQRLVARIIDWLLMLIPGTALGSLVVFNSNVNHDYLAVYGNAFAALIGFVYEGLMLTRAGGQTLGKKAMRIRVGTVAEGTRPTDGRAWTRAAVFWLPGALSSLCVPSLFALANVLWCTWDRPYRQCLHDKAAKTVVVQAVPGG